VPQHTGRTHDRNRTGSEFFPFTPCTYDVDRFHPWRVGNASGGPKRKQGHNSPQQGIIAFDPDNN
jgi:hypothetical protein